MPSGDLQALCAVCGRPVAGVEHTGAHGRGVRCVDCFDGYLRSIDLGFLEHLGEFGIRSRQVVAETCLRALVLANASDRKLLGLSIYEQFVHAASDLIALVGALQGRERAPISEAFLGFRLDERASRGFFAALAGQGGVELLATLGLPSPEREQRSLTRKEQRELKRALQFALADIEKLRALRDLGERALALAAGHFAGGAVAASQTGWLAGRNLSPAQVASVALDGAHGRLDVAALRVDEERMAQVVDGIDIMTRLARNVIYAFVTLHQAELAARQAKTA